MDLTQSASHLGYRLQGEQEESEAVKGLLSLMAHTIITSSLSSSS
jgi:hypothetical protein